MGKRLSVRTTHTPVQPASASRQLLQRLCDCGRPKGPFGRCAECARKRPGDQTRLTVNRPGDRYELEADQVADKVVRMPDVDRFGKSFNGMLPPSQERPKPVDDEPGSARLEGSPPGPMPALGQQPPDLGDGRPLSHSERSFFEPRFGHNFGDVRLFTGSNAQNAATSLNARAYTKRNNIVFGRDAYRPGTDSGRRLLAHELTHVIQQTKPAQQIQEQNRIPPLGHSTGNRAVTALSPALRTPATSPVIQRYSGGRSEHDVDGLPPTSRPLKGWASDYGGTPIPMKNMNISVEELKEIYPQLAADAAKKPPLVTEEQLNTFAYYLSQAFKLMRLDTVEAQAAYLAHGAVESDQFRRFTETQGWRQRYEGDPTKIRLDTNWLNQAGKNPRYPSYKMGGSINPNRDPSWQSSYIGRGPVQVTHRLNYAKTLQQMEQMAGEYQAAGDSASAETLREAVTAIRADPRQAANPRYTFLFSAAYEKWTGGEKDVAEVGEKATFTGGGPESRWVTGGSREKARNARLKAGAWERARKVLMRKKAPEPNTDPSTYTGPSYDPSASRIPA